MHRFSHNCDDFHMLLLEHDYQERAGVQEYYKMYKMYEMYKKHLILTSLSSDILDPRWLCSAEVLPVTPDSFHPQWFDLRQSQLFHLPSYDILWRARTRVFHLCTMIVHCLLNNLYNC